MSNLAVLSLKNRALIALVTIVVAIFGGIALNSLKQELIPSIEFPALIVVSTYPGASPEVVSNDVSSPIESAIQAVPGLESTTATSTTNASIVQASFTYGTDLGTAEQKITQAINRIPGGLPDGVEPNVISASIDDFPVIQLAVTGYDDEETIQSTLDSTVIPELEDIDGVNAAQVVGGVGQRITITPDAEALAAAGFSQQAITDALEQNGVLFPGGEITEDSQTLTVQTGSKITSLEEVANLPLVPSDESQFQAGPQTIGDVADVVQERDPVTTVSRVNGDPALTIAITKLPAANTVEVSQAVVAALPGLEDQLSGVELSVIFDQAPYIEKSIETLAVEGGFGLLFAVLVILVFLLSVRATLVTAISIPTSLLVTFIGLQAFGYSLNILTLGAITISIGRVVDDSIVVIENIRRHYVGNAPKLASIIRAVREVASAITSSTITTVAVFLPIAFVGDVTGELFRPFALTASLALLASLVVALTIVPVLAYWFLKPGKPLLDAQGREIDPENPTAPMDRLQKGYAPVLRWTLRHSFATLGIAILVLAGTVALAPLMKTNFLGDSGQNTFTMTQSIGEAPSLEAEAAAAEPVEAAIVDIEGIETVQVSIGSSGNALRDAFAGGGSGITYSITTETGVDQVALREEVQRAIDGLDDVGDVTIAGGNGGFGSTDIEIDVTAPDATTLQEATDAVVASLDGLDDVSQVTSNLSASLPFISVVVDRERAAELGLSEVAVGALVSNTMQPQSIGSVEIDDAGLTVYLAVVDPPTTIDELRDLEVFTAQGPLPLSDVATVEESQGPTSITTERGVRTSTVTVTPATDNLAQATQSVTEALEGADLPSAADATLGGVVSDQNEAFTQLGLALLAAILIVYVVMVATFKSLRQPLLLLISVPFAATGAIILQVITGIPLGVASLIGVLMLIGIVVTNAIVLIDLVNQYREKGLSAYEATVAGAVRRLRPILMTALATILALTPLGLGITGSGGFISQPLAIVVIGGLISSTLLTLLVLPALYNLVEGAKERRLARRTGGADSSTNAEGDAAGASGAPVAPMSRRELRARERGVADTAGVPVVAGTATALATVAVPVIEEAPDVEVPSTDAEPPAGAAEAAAEDAESGGALESPVDEGPGSLSALAAADPVIEEAPDVEVPSTDAEPPAGAAEAAAEDALTGGVHNPETPESDEDEQDTQDDQDSQDEERQD
ncbi:efflux RND transporter permease subunit [Microbacterium aurantiacum]|uniref:Efflux RND transporter permease subunit n=1 Tax=Microbacterium aurantiacum TaxID=162393 RepID=A0AAJ2HHN9_9MICO|nr:efflux RND transporter permease subunit [Microbacterium aurantiacum]MDS0244670.1 efflux RND transporter permease subunit [Microbacterium aurantiacum]